MKNLLIFMLCLTVAGLAFGVNTSTVNQTGMGNIHTLIQTGDGHMSTVDQTALAFSPGHTATVTQTGGNNNTSDVDQNGNDHMTATVTQTGNNNIAIINQFRNGQTGTITQTGDWNYGQIDGNGWATNGNIQQVGSYNHAEQWMGQGTVNDHSSFSSVQNGNGNYSYQWMAGRQWGWSNTGNNTGTATQTGAANIAYQYMDAGPSTAGSEGNTASSDQDGTNMSWQGQYGAYNSSTIKQVGSTNTGATIQWDTKNKIVGSNDWHTYSNGTLIEHVPEDKGVYQNGSGNYVEIKQASNMTNYGHQAAVRQVGNGNQFIANQSGDAFNLGFARQDGNINVGLLTQVGKSCTFYLYQNGDINFVAASQTSGTGGHSSEVFQSGNNNSTTIIQ